MARGNLRVAGSSGALPAWVLTAQGLNTRGLLGEPEESTDEAVWPLVLDKSLRVAMVDKASGLPVAATEEPQPLLFYRRTQADTAEAFFELFDGLRGDDEKARPVRAAP